MMQDTCVKRPYDIKHLKQDIIFEFSDLANNFYWRKVQISKVREICIDPSKNTIKIKYDLRKPAQIADVFKKDVNYSNLINNLTLRPAYNGKIQLSEKKIKDLTIMVQQKWIPPKYAEFYSHILS